ncbi:hypothetical protein EOB36_32325 [Mesorhizobium sp. M6A.T.Cr.TU.017.01.1.1]|uniref:hypothetical protein n=1 Tax=Mesorhizobium sp. M6A.T.Cr.TU.017.01.1.1 TaxID=2496774 RepID=UPI000FD35B07|nr:hypothetical protein [Mesorhizobium sp. M6A.T.Cr.TU.017.01.1.1]RUU95498.1 hypothetical protein EOB36_32325 [Mesorhizobium sp. M6A.T.Cr.TU.017.01.1.1]
MSEPDAMGGAVRREKGFRYTNTERQALADAVPDPDWLDALDDWGRLVRFPHHDEFRADKAGFIARHLEGMARECLGEEEIAFRSSKEEADHIRETARVARKLKALLVKPTAYQRNVATALLGISVPPYRHAVFLSLLDDLIHNETWVAERFAAMRAEDVFAGKHHPAFARFVDAAIISWRQWTDKPAGGSKEGGPAARFLCAAVNPVLAFAERRALRLRRGGALTEGAAGELIEEIRRLDPPIE